MVLYDYEKKQEIRRIELQGVTKSDPAASGIAFSPDGRLLAVAVAVLIDGDTHVNNGSVKIYSAEDGTEVAHTGLQEGKKKNRKPPDKPITAIAFTWIGRTLQMTTANAEGVWVWPDENEPPDSELKGELRYERMVTRGSTKGEENTEKADADKSKPKPDLPPTPNYSVVACGRTDALH